MTGTLARKIALWSLIAWVVSVVIVLLFGNPLSGAEEEIVGIADDAPDRATAVGVILLAAGTALLLSWVTSMVAGPVALVKMRGGSDALGVWNTIVLPLSLAVGLTCAIAFPVRWTDGCVNHGAVVPLITVPIYLFGSPESAPVAYFRLGDKPACSGV